MPSFRCYILNGLNSIVSVDSVEAEDDALAMSLAGGLLRERYSNSAAIEVWHQKRVVGRIENLANKPRTIESLLKPTKPMIRTGND
jgi:hypothetical protein